MGGLVSALVEDDYVLCPRTLGTLGDVEFHFLTFAQVIEACVLERGAVEEDFFSLTGDETKSFVRDELLDRSLGHGGPPSKRE